jgi:serine/threonine protein kinase
MGHDVIDENQSLFSNTEVQMPVTDLDGAEEVLTEYVVTRWYRAPELLCETSYYGKPVDIWGLGCTFAELLRKKPFFCGSSPMHQLEIILSILGCPSNFQTFKYCKSEIARSTFGLFQEKITRPFHLHFPPKTSLLAIDLLKRMLAIDPNERITAEEALKHPYLKNFIDHEKVEPKCERLFDFSFENELKTTSSIDTHSPLHFLHDPMIRRAEQELSDKLRRAMWDEVTLFRPPPTFKQQQQQQQQQQQEESKECSTSNIYILSNDSPPSTSENLIPATNPYTNKHLLSSTFPLYPADTTGDSNEKNQRETSGNQNDVI